MHIWLNARLLSDKEWSWHLFRNDNRYHENCANLTSGAGTLWRGTLQPSDSQIWLLDYSKLLDNTPRVGVISRHPYNYS